MPAYFDVAFAYVLVNEGAGYVNDPDDSGGPTRYGVTLATLQNWRTRNAKGPTSAIKAADVAALTVTEAGAIYRAMYWDKVGGDGLTDSSIATCLFDAAVNTGVGWAAKGAQTVAAELTKTPLKIDGLIGPKTVAAINACERRAFLRAFVTRQEDYYLDIVEKRPTQRKFRKTWLRRAALYLDLNF